MSRSTLYVCSLYLWRWKEERKKSQSFGQTDKHTRVNGQRDLTKLQHCTWFCRIAMKCLGTWQRSRHHFETHHLATMTLGSRTTTDSISMMSGPAPPGPPWTRRPRTCPAVAATTRSQTSRTSLPTPPSPPVPIPCQDKSKSWEETTKATPAFDCHRESSSSSRCRSKRPS